MNYLAHLLLAEQSPEGWLGALMGDFVKGRLDPSLGAVLRRGILLHRRIDSFTDAHPTHRASRNRIAGGRRRFAGIIVDLSYDHFLAQRWGRHSAAPLDAFTGRVYAALARRRDLLPPRLARLAPRMISQDWLGSYRDLDALGAALDGLATRSPRSAPLAGAIEEVRRCYQGLGDDFDAFFPELVAHAKALRAAGWRAASAGVRGPPPGAPAVQRSSIAT